MWRAHVNVIITWVFTFPRSMGEKKSGVGLRVGVWHDKHLHTTHSFRKQFSCNYVTNVWERSIVARYILCLPVYIPLTQSLPFFGHKKCTSRLLTGSKCGDSLALNGQTWSSCVCLCCFVSQVHYQWDASLCKVLKDKMQIKKTGLVFQNSNSIQSRSSIHHFILFVWHFVNIKNCYDEKTTMF